MSCCGNDSGSKKKTAANREKPTKNFTFTGPSVGGPAYAVFDEGRCYRVEGKKRWYLYNDTFDSEMHINFSFAPGNAIRKPKYGRTDVKKLPSKWTQCTVVVYPLETIKFVNFKKEVNGYRASNSCRPLTAGYIEKKNEEAVNKCAKESRAVSTVASHTHNEEELLYNCRKSGINYVDFSFHPGEASLMRSVDTRQVKGMSNIAWKRPQDYIPPEWRKFITLYDKHISPDNIWQGQLGDCWLMCSIAVVAESKTMVKDIFRHPVSKSKQKKEQKFGGYRVYLNKCGWWRNVIVDSYLPTLNGAICFGRAAENPFELWVSLLEKAYAKVHGSYSNIIGGDALNALQDLTGFPTFCFDDTWAKATTNDEVASRFFKDLLRYRKKKYLISIGTPGQDTSGYNVGNSGPRNNVAFEERYRKAGLGTGHAYSVLSVRQFSMPSIKLLKIRNPWGTGMEWTGDWSTGSEKWKKHPLVRHSCKPSKKNDGTFWMEWRDVVKYFDGGGVCMVRKTWYDYRFPGKFVDIYPSVSLKMEVTKRQKIFFTLSQKDRRLLSKNDPEQLYKGFLITVTRYNPTTGNQDAYAFSTSNPEVHQTETFTYLVRRDSGIELILEPWVGPYYVIPRIMVANRSGPKEFTLGMLTPNKSTEKQLNVSFVRLPETCQFFKNFKEFKIENETPLNLQFQYKKREGVPRLKEGTSVSAAQYVKEEFPFPY